MLRKLIVVTMALAMIALVAEDLFAQARGGRGGRGGFRPGAAQRQRNQADRQQSAEEQRMEREFGPSSEDPDDEREIYRGAVFTDAQIRAGVKKFIREADTDRDGKLSEHEFEGVETAKIFGFLDRNRDGFLDEDELEIYMREKMPADVAKEILDKETEKLMKRHDRNKNGEVDAEEWRGKDDEFNEIDTNGDLKISEEEMRAWARKEFEDKYDARLPNDKTRFQAPTGGRASRGGDSDDGDTGARPDRPSREDWENMSDEEKQKLREEWRQRMGQRGNQRGQRGGPDNGGNGPDNGGNGGGDDPDDPSSGG